jgi:hypothetical protein
MLKCFVNVFLLIYNIVVTRTFGGLEIVTCIIESGPPLHENLARSTDSSDSVVSWFCP